MSGVWINATVTNTAAAVTDKDSGAVIPNKRNSLIIHNPSNTASVAFTMDGTTPAVGTNGITLGPLGTTTADISPLCGPISMISNATSQSVTIYYEQ